MLAFRSKEAIAGRPSRWYRAIQKKSASPAAHSSITPTELVVDSKGTITDCSDDLLQAMGVLKDDVAGKNVRSLIPALPFQAQTEGYNIAYATFAAAHKEPRTWVIKRGDGCSIEVKGRVAIHRMPNRYAIRLAISTLPSHVRTPQRENRGRRLDTGRILPHAMSPSGATSRKYLHLMASQEAGVPAMGMQPAAQMRSGTSGSRVHLTLDSKFRIGFASSSLEDLFGIDYEQVVGTQASVLLPDLQNQLGHASTVRSARTSLRQMGAFLTHARHANGHAVPVMVSIQEEGADRLITLQLELKAY